MQGSPETATSHPPVASAEPEHAPSEGAKLGELASEWASLTVSRLKTTVHLALAEAKLAALSLVLMVFLAVIAAVFALGAWGLLMAGAVVGLQIAGLPLWGSLATLGVLHLVAFVFLWRVMMALSRNLDMSATRYRAGMADGSDGGKGNDDESAPG